MFRASLHQDQGRGNGTVGPDVVKALPGNNSTSANERGHLMQQIVPECWRRRSVADDDRPPKSGINARIQRWQANDPLSQGSAIQLSVCNGTSVLISPPKNVGRDRRITLAEVWVY